MKLAGAIVVIIIAILLYVAVCIIVRWMFDFDKKTDVKMFKTELDDYENDKRCAIAGVTVIFVIITAGVLFWIFTRW